MSAFLEWRAKDADGENVRGVDFDEFVLWLRSPNKRKDVVHLEVMGDHDLFISIAGVIFNLHVTQKGGAELKLTEGELGEDGVFKKGR